MNLGACIHCGTVFDRDVAFECPVCGERESQPVILSPRRVPRPEVDAFVESVFAEAMSPVELDPPHAF